MNELRNFIKSSPIIYPFYINRIRRLNIDFPNEKTDFHLTGFPRSANTYCRQIVKEVFPELNIVSHIHTIASLKKALKHKVPIALLLRSPLSTTSSMLMKFDYKKEEEVLYDYIKYHNFVLKNIKEIKIFRFEEVIESPLKLIDFIKTRCAIDISRECISERLRVGDTKSKNKEINKDPLGSSRPNSIKDSQKGSYEKLIISHKLYHTANNLYLKVRN